MLATTPGTKVPFNLVIGSPLLNLKFKEWKARQTVKTNLSMGKPNKPQATAAGKDNAAHANPAGKELFVLKYLRLSSNDLARTKDFYVSLGMGVEWQVRSNKPATGMPGLPSTQEDGRLSIVGVTVTVEPSLDTEAAAIMGDVESDKRSADAASKKDELAPDANASSKMDLCMSFNTDASADQNPFQLIFESGGGQKEEDAQAPQPVSKTNTLKTKEDASEKKDRNQEYLVVYVHFLPRIIKRLASKGFETTLPITSFQSAQIAILTDPNGIEVRLIELTEPQSDDPSVSSKRQWFARLGYYTVPSVKTESTVRYYERMFTYVPQVTVPEKGAKKGAAGDTHRFRKTKKPSTSEAGQMHSNLAVCFVSFTFPASSDSNMLFIASTGNTTGRFGGVCSLTKTQFMWLGHEPRSLGFSLCFTGKVLAESQEIRPSDRSESCLLGVGVEVPNLDTLVRRWEWERPNEVLWEPGRIRIPGIGQYARFRDPNNELWIEMFHPKAIDPTENLPKKDAAEAAATAAPRISKDMIEKLPTLPSLPAKTALDLMQHVNAESGGSEDVQINPQYLGGLSKTLSAGAIEKPSQLPTRRAKTGKTSERSRTKPLEDEMNEKVQQLDEKTKFESPEANLAHQNKSLSSQF
ncbi:hypothetical protein HDU80_005561 [Chytriomyces hyalinus]|nr:hypothetical protein HDU80_005561 [Chytriomyces hyalinus]